MIVLLVLAVSVAVVLAVLISRIRLPATGNPIAVLGSGGHTGELLAILQTANFQGLDFISGRGDSLSVIKCKAAGFENSSFYEVPRARKVGEAKLSSAVSVLRSLVAAVLLILKLRPKTLICNGPATCVIVVAACRLFRLSTRIVYIESLARVQHLSLSGTIIYYLKWADRFLVQWPELKAEYPRAEYVGCLV